MVCTQPHRTHIQVLIYYVYYALSAVSSRPRDIETTFNITAQQPHQSIGEAQNEKVLGSPCQQWCIGCSVFKNDNFVTVNVWYFSVAGGIIWHCPSFYWTTPRASLDKQIWKLTGGHFEGGKIETNSVSAIPTILSSSTKLQTRFWRGGETRTTLPAMVWSLSCAQEW